MLYALGSPEALLPKAASGVRQEQLLTASVGVDTDW